MDILKTNHGTSDGIVITKQPKLDGFEINGNIYKGIEDLLCTKVTVIGEMHYKFDVYRDRFGNYVLHKWEPYPCFDSSDRMYENRHYRSYMICTSEDEAIEKYHYIMKNNSNCEANEYTPSFLAPLIYADDGNPKICIMTDSNKNTAHQIK